MSDDNHPGKETGMLILGHRPATFWLLYVVPTITGAYQAYEIIMNALAEPNVSSGWRIAGIAVGVLISLMLLLGACFVGAGLFVEATRRERPQGRIFDFALPPEDAEDRALEMEIAFERWSAKYSLPTAWALYAWQATIVIGMYWFDRFTRRTR